MNKVSVDDVFMELNSLLEESAGVLPFVTDQVIQESTSKKLDQHLKIIKAYKKQAKIKNDEGISNSLLYYQCAFHTQIEEIKFIIALKNQEWHAAWVLLINAEDYCKYSIRAFEKSSLFQESYVENLNNELNRLKSLEKIFFHTFPIYHSFGFSISGGICSICGENIDTCTHIEEEIYMGSVCKRILLEEHQGNIVVDHSAMVKNPKDRRCIVTNFCDANGNYIDYITKKNLPKEKSMENGTFKMVLFSANNLDLF